MEKCFNQAAVTHKRDRITGVHSVDYKILKANKLTIDGAEVEVLNVRLECDHDRTPWCDCTGQAADLAKSAKDSAKKEGAADSVKDSAKSSDPVKKSAKPDDSGKEADKEANPANDSIKVQQSVKLHPKTSAGRAAAAQPASKT